MSALTASIILRVKDVFEQARLGVFQRVSSSTSGTNLSDASNQGIGQRASDGCVHLIGAGPGDAELLTIKAYKAIQQAEVILYDALVGEDVVAMFPASAQKMYVGKRYGQHSMTQPEICRVLLELAQSGKRVVRLKGGDPAIFARAGEECALLAQHDIPFVVVPGITAASGASAYAGIPLTHRDCAQSVRFVTAHLKDESAEPDWSSMAPSQKTKHGETLVFYMGLRRIEQICQRLIQHGVDKDMPVAVIEHATHAEQRVCIGTLATIADRVETSGISGPAITIVGRVVEYRYQTANLMSDSVLSGDVSGF